MTAMIRFGDAQVVDDETTDDDEKIVVETHVTIDGRIMRGTTTLAEDWRAQVSFTTRAPKAGIELVTVLDPNEPDESYHVVSAETRRFVAQYLQVPADDFADAFAIAHAVISGARADWH